MNLPVPSLGPPALPAHAAPWIAVKVIGRPAFEALWSACWWSGFATSTLVFVVALSLIQFARSRKP